MSKQVITQQDNMSTISAKMSQNYDELLAKIDGSSYTASEGFDAFVAEMNKYAARFGMTNTRFDNPHGLPDTNTHKSCARDMAKMAMCCTGYNKLMEFWGQTSYSVPVGGPNARTISGDSTYKGQNMTTVGDYYHIYGGKSGSLVVSNVRYENLVLVCKSKVDDAWLSGCILYNTHNPTSGNMDNRGVPFKQMLDWLEDVRQNPSTPSQTVEAQHCSAFVIPPHNPMAYQEVTLEQVGKSSTTMVMPASCTKLMTAMVALDHLSLDETITVVTSDIRSGSGDTFYNGDTLNVADAMLAMLLPSSNTLATTFARIAGWRILAGK